MKPRRLALLAIAGACLSGAAAGQDRQPIYRMVWNVAPQGNVGETRMVQPGEIAVTLALTPPALLRSTQDIGDAQGELLAPAGTQFVLLKSEARIACTIHQTRRNAAEQMLFLGSLKRLCLIDADRDGRFERRFLRATNAQAYFLLRGRLSGRQQEIAPTALAEEDLAALREPPVIEVKLDPSTRADRRARITASVGAPGGGFPLGVRLSADRFPAVFELYGGRIEIAPRPEGGFTVRTLAPFSDSELDFWD